MRVGKIFGRPRGRVFEQFSQAQTASWKKPFGGGGATSGSDFYSYVGNDPTDKTDPTGLVGGSDHYEDVLAKRVPPAVTPEQALDSGKWMLNQVATASESIAGAYGGGPIAEPIAVELRALSEVSVEGRALSRAEQIGVNAAQGRAGEAITEAKLGDSIAGKQVSFRTSDKSLTRIDFLKKDMSVVDTKTGGAGLSINQEKLHADIAAGLEVTPVGKNAANAGLTPGTPIKLTGFDIDRPF